MSWSSLPKAWKTIHVVTETFTRRSECKFLYTACYRAYFFYRRQTKFAFLVPNYDFLICSEVFSFSCLLNKQFVVNSTTKY